MARLTRNADPQQHPFERDREYTRALVATKLERMFAKPFVAQLGRGHVDGVYVLAQDSSALDRCASGSGDGVVKVWDLESKSELWHVQAHEAIVRGLCWTKERRILSCASDRTIKLFDPYNSAPDSPPLGTWLGHGAFTALSHHQQAGVFAASSDSISIYDLNHVSSTPIQKLSWPTAHDTLRCLAFNPSETSVLASASTDRSLTLYDLRTSSALHRTIMTLAPNSLCWNPMEPFNIAAASEDHNIYLFDTRNMKRALNVLRDHVNAVMDISFSPTGQELVSASYDRTVRLWRRNEGHSRDVYHTKRMQRVFSAKYTADSKYVISGSDDGNVRVWRANASERSGVASARQRLKMEYDQALRARYGHLPEIRRIGRHRHVPRVIMKESEKKAVETGAAKRRKQNERKYSRKGEVGPSSEREKMVLATER